MLTLLVSACSGELGSSADSTEPVISKVSEQTAQPSSQAKSPQLISEKLQQPQVIGRTDKDGGCDITISYPQKGNHHVLWPNEPCNKIEAGITSIDELVAINQLDDVPGYILDDMRQFNGEGMVLVESEFTMSVFIFDAKGKLYEVPLAD